MALHHMNILEVDIVHEGDNAWAIFEGGELVKVVWSIQSAQEVAYDLKPTKINYHTSRRVYNEK